MVLLRAKKLDEIPKGSTILTEEQALKEQWDAINNHDNVWKVWSLRYGAGILGSVGAVTGVYINHFYRGRLRLGRFGHFSSYLPIVALPALVSTLYHRVFIQSQIVLNTVECPVCLQVKASLFQVALGVGYPALLSPVATYMFAQRHFTYRLPPFSRYKELFAVYKKMTRPLTMFFSIAAAVHVLAAMALTQKEILDFYRLEQEEVERELLR